MYLVIHRRDLRLHSTRFSVARILAVLMLLSVGCGPFGFIKKVSQPVNRSLAQARVAGAEELAAYEYWSAVAYYEQARELMGYSEYERALDYGTRAKQFADEAKVKAERVRMGQSIESIAPSTPDAPSSSTPGTSTRPGSEAPKDRSADPTGEAPLKANLTTTGPFFQTADLSQGQVVTIHDSQVHIEEVSIRGGK